MSCEHLVCANCAGPVDEGRCPVCRAAHAQLHHQGVSQITPTAMFAIITAVAIVLLLLGLH
jgi:RNA polymerase subunit RPABC4/transcription elongation factor Spt4